MSLKESSAAKVRVLVKKANTQLDLEHSFVKGDKVTSGKNDHNPSSQATNRNSEQKHYSDAVAPNKLTNEIAPDLPIT
jgi:hypothetical protein